jgi:hypothetical protein
LLKLLGERRALKREVAMESANKGETGAEANSADKAKETTRKWIIASGAFGMKTVPQVP